MSTGPIAQRRARVQALAVRLPHSANEIEGLLVEARTVYDAIFGLALAAAPGCLVAAATASSFPMLMMLIASGVAFGIAYTSLRAMQHDLSMAPSRYLQLAWQERQKRVLGGRGEDAEILGSDQRTANTKVWDDLATRERGVWSRSLAAMATGTVLLVLGLSYQGRDLLRGKAAETAQEGRAPVPAAAPAGVGSGKVAAPAPGAAGQGDAGKPGHEQGSTDTAAHGKSGVGAAAHGQSAGDKS